MEHCNIYKQFLNLDNIGHVQEVERGGGVGDTVPCIIGHLTAMLASTYQIPVVFASKS